MNTKRRKSVMLSSKIALESLKSSEIKNEKENQNKNIKSRKSVQLKRQMTIQEDNSEKTLKRRASLTSSVEQIKVSQLAKRRSSYSDLFLLKLNYIPNDFSLSQKPESGYSNLYKNGIRVFDELDKENSNSFKSSFTLSNNISKTSLDKKYMRRSSLQPNFFRNQNFDFLNCGDDSLGNKYDKNNTGKSTRNLSKKKKHKKKKKNNSSYSESNSDSSNSGSDISSNSNSDIEEKARKKLGLFEKERELKKNNSDKIEGKALRNSFQELNNNNNEVFSHRKNRKNKTVRLNACEERIKYLLGNGSIIKDHVNNQIIKEVEEEYEDGRLSNNILSNSLKNTKGNFWKRDLLKEQLDKINEMEDEIKKLILKKNHSFNNIKNKNVEEMILDKKDFYKFFHRSKSLGNILIKNKRYNMNNIENIIKKNKELNSKIYNKDLKGEEYKKLKLDGITYDETANNTNEKVNSPSSLLKLNPDELNSSEIKKKNGESFFTRGKISFLEIDNDNNKNYSSIFKKNYLNNINNSENKKEEEDTSKIIDNLLKKIRENNIEKKNILNLFKEENDKELEQLKKQKEEIKERKVQFSKEKKEKENEKLRFYSEKKCRNKIKIFENSKTISIALPIVENNEKKSTLSFNNNHLKLLSEPILTSKEKNLVSLKHSLNDIELLSPKKEIYLDSNEDNINNSINFDNIINSSLSIQNNISNLKYINIKPNNNLREKNENVKSKRKYLNLLKNDMLDLKKRKNNNKKPCNFKNIQLKKFRKGYIMPVNDMDDVIEINNVYISLNGSLNVSHKKK